MSPVLAFRLAPLRADPEGVTRARPTLLMLLAIVLAGVVADARAATGRPAGWLWSTALCTSALNSTGVEISDGRVFRGLVTVCAGSPGRCAVADGAAFFAGFHVTMVDRSLVRRTMRVHVTGEGTFRVTRILVHGTAASHAEAVAWTRSAATPSLAQELAARRGCTRAPRA